MGFLPDCALWCFLGELLVVAFGCSLRENGAPPMVLKVPFLVTVRRGCWEGGPGACCPLLSPGCWCSPSFGVSVCVSYCLRGPSWLLVSLVIVSLLALRKFQFEWRTRNDFLFVGVYFQFPISVISFEQNHLEMRTCSVEACQNFIEQSSEMRNHFPGDLVRSMYSNFCWASALSHRSAVPVRHFPSMCR